MKEAKTGQDDTVWEEGVSVERNLKIKPFCLMSAKSSFSNKPVSVMSTKEGIPQHREPGVAFTGLINLLPAFAGMGTL